MTHSNILVVDDNYHQHEIFSCYASTDKKIELSHANSLLEALDSIDSNAPDMILLDNQLPPYNNYTQTVPKIRAAGFAGRIVIISANTRHIIRAEAKSYSVHDCLDKFDFNLKNFSQTINSLLN